MNFLSVTAEGTLFVLDTNYLNYAVIYACGVLNKVHSQMVWILSRSRSLQAQFLNASLDALKKNNLPVNNLMLSDQSNCPV